MRVNTRCSIGGINTAFNFRLNLSTKMKICLEVSEGNFWNFSSTGFQIRFRTFFPLSCSSILPGLPWNTILIHSSWWIRINYIIQIGEIGLTKKKILEYNLQLVIYIPGDDGRRAASTILFTEFISNYKSHIPVWLEIKASFLYTFSSFWIILVWKHTCKNCIY